MDKKSEFTIPEEQRSIMNVGHGPPFHVSPTNGSYGNRTLNYHGRQYGINGSFGNFDNFRTFPRSAAGFRGNLEPCLSTPGVKDKRTVLIRKKEHQASARRTSSVFRLKEERNWLKLSFRNYLLLLLLLSLLGSSAGEHIADSSCHDEGPTTELTATVGERKILVCSYSAWKVRECGAERCEIVYTRDGIEAKLNCTHQIQTDNNKWWNMSVIFTEESCRDYFCINPISGNTSLTYRIKVIGANPGSDPRLYALLLVVLAILAIIAYVLYRELDVESDNWKYHRPTARELKTTKAMAG